jgi:hypothetical protein
MTIVIFTNEIVVEPFWLTLASRKKFKNRKFKTPAETRNGIVSGRVVLRVAFTPTEKYNTTI